jgi:hypothetical protein
MASPVEAVQCYGRKVSRTRKLLERDVLDTGVQTWRWNDWKAFTTVECVDLLGIVV